MSRLLDLIAKAKAQDPQLAEPTELVVGGGYYVLDRLADPTEVVTLIGEDGGVAIVRGARGVERAVAADQLSRVPSDEFYRDPWHRISKVRNR